MRDLRMTRRGLAHAVAGASVLAGTLTPRSDGSPDQLMAVLADFRRRVLASFDAEDIHDLVVAGHKVLAQTGISDCEQLVLRLCGHTQADSPVVTSTGDLRAAIDNQIRHDFANGHMENVGGWMLSRTELLIVALTARKPL